MGKLLGNSPFIYNDAGTKIVAIHNPDGTETPMPYILAQSGIPMILPSSGTMGANGALSGLTALPVTYSSCYMYFPAGAVYAASVAGMYYVQMSSTTAGTVFNNIYASGIPVIPSAPTAIVAAGPGAYTQTTASNIQLFTVTLPANSMGANGSIRLHCLGNSINNVNSKFFLTQLGGANILSVTVTTAAAIPFIHRTCNRAATNKQVSQNWFNSGVASFYLYSSVDTTADQALSFFVNLSVATDWQVWENIEIEVLPS